VNIHFRGFLSTMATNGSSLPERHAKKQPVLARADEVSTVRLTCYFLYSNL